MRSHNTLAVERYQSLVIPKSINQVYQLKYDMTEQVNLMNKFHEYLIKLNLSEHLIAADGKFDNIQDPIIYRRIREAVIDFLLTHDLIDLDYPIKVYTIRELLQAIQNHNNHSRKVVIKRIDIHSWSLKDLKDAINAHQCDVIIDLSNNDIGHNKSELYEFIEMIANTQCPRNLEIFLSHNALVDDDIVLIADALKRAPQGLKLHLDSNPIGNAGVKALAQAINSGQCPHDLHINLNWNKNIGFTSVAELFSALGTGKCPHGLQISLMGVGIDDHALKPLCDSITTSKCPQGLKLFLQCNKITDKGAIALADILESGSCPMGLEINLEDNHKISDFVASQIKAQLKINDIRHSALSCVAFQQGVNSSQFKFKHFPQVLAEKIYEFVLPKPHNSLQSKLITYRIKQASVHYSLFASINRDTPKDEQNQKKCCVIM